MTILTALLLTVAPIPAVATAMPATYSANYDPTLSPDGKRMIFIKLLEGHEQLFIADANCWRTGRSGACEIVIAPAPAP